MKATVPYTPVARSTAAEGQSKVMELMLPPITSFPNSKSFFFLICCSSFLQTNLNRDLYGHCWFSLFCVIFLCTEFNKIILSPLNGLVANKI